MAGPDNPSRSPRDRWRSFSAWIVKLAISFGILAYLLSHVPLGEVWRALASVHPAYLALGLAAIPVTGLLAAAEQKVLSDRQGLRLSVLKIAQINLMREFYALFLPSAVAGIIRWHRMAQPSKRPAEALAAVVFNRGLDVIVAVALGLVFWLWARPADVNPAVSFLLVTALAGLLALQAAAFNRRVTDWVGRLLAGDRMRSLPAIVRKKLGKAVSAAGVFDALPKRTIGYMSGLAVIRQLIGVLVLVWFARAIGVDLLFAVAGWIQAFLHILLTIPISIAGLGVREAGLVVSLQGYGVTPADALAISMLLFGKKLIRAGVGGVIELHHAFLSPEARLRGGSNASEELGEAVRVELVEEADELEVVDRAR